MEQQDKSQLFISQITESVSDDSDWTWTHFLKYNFLNWSTVDLQCDISFKYTA